jgi:hypothetical protein
MGLLQAQDFSALVLYDTLRLGLRQQLGEQTFIRLEAAMQSLRFREAMALLSPLP